MADYWKSTGKHYCDFCKCWTADNKSSIQFHENGKNHQANIKRKLAEIKKNSIDKRKKDEKHQKMFQEMEKAALAAVQKDINNSDGSVGKSDLRNVVKAHSKSSDSNNDEDEFKNAIYPWQIMSGPQGTIYYYNSSTGESTWIVPEAVQDQREKRKRKLEDSKEEGKPPTNSFYSSQISPSSTSTNKQLRDPFRQLPKEEEEPEEVRDAHPLLGGWSTVKRVEPEEENEEGEQTSVKFETSEDTAQEESSSTTTQVEPPGKKFKEKIIKTSITTKSDEPVAFKKRKSGNRNVRRRNDDD